MFLLPIEFLNEKISYLVNNQFLKFEKYEE